MKNAIFLDRDGVLTDNSRHYYLTKEEEVRLNPGVPEALAALKKKGYEFVVITNQGGISLGKNSRLNVEKVHARLHALLNEKKIRILETYYCPHHGDVEKCLCRKPLPLMIEKALARFGFHREGSFFIGDSERDMEAAFAAGIRGVLVESNGDLRKVLDRGIF